MEEKLLLENWKNNIRNNVPNFFTMGNLVLGMLALIYIMEGLYELSISLILIAMVLDGIDGKLAVRLKVCSELGKQLDSLCDLVSFGIVPAILFYSISLSQFGFIGLFVAILFPLAGAYRLARFNLVAASSPSFMGLPITIAGGAVAALSLHSSFYLTWVAPFYILALVLLMVSKLQYPSFKKVQRELNFLPFVLLYASVSLFILFIIFMREAIFYLLMVYIVFGLLSSIYKLIKNNEKEPASILSGDSREC